MNSYQRNLERYERFLRRRDGAVLSIVIAFATAAVLMMVFLGCATIPSGSIDWDRALEAAERIDSALAERRAAVEARDAFERAADRDRAVFIAAAGYAAIVFRDTSDKDRALEVADRMAFAGRGVDFMILAQRVWDSGGISPGTVPPIIVELMNILAPIFEERIGALEAEEVGP